MRAAVPGHVLIIWLLTGLLSSPVGADEGTIWIEGESCSQHTMRRHAWYDSVDKGSLSGGDWLSHFAEGRAPEATYSFQVAASNSYHFWVRCNPVGQARLSYKLDGGGWQEVSFSQALDQINIAADGKPDLRFIAWVNVGQVSLERGRHSIAFRFDSRNNHHGAIDCFVFSREPFQPRGLLKPGERSGLANAGFFAWEPDVDTFRDTALVDLRYLNEDVAGQSGRVRSEGNGFMLGDGKKVKFWAANAGPSIWSLDPQSHIYLARRLAKAGVNMVRLHGPIYGERDPKVDLQRLNQLHHLVYALKQEGIYTHLSFYFPLWFYLDEDRRPFMLLFFDRDLQQLYAGWADQLLNTENPFTGLPLGQDPAVAIVELINEDSHFFWTFGKKNMPEKRWRELTGQYGDWLKEKYGSVDKALAAWQGVREPGDDPVQGRMELYGAWDMTADGIRSNPKRKSRLSDQVQFLTQNMRDFYTRVISYLRRRCSYDGLISCGNWHVADPSILDALERYCYTAGDVIDHHGYFDHGHEGDAASYSVRSGQTFTSQSALHLQQPNPLPYVETEGYPHIISEIGWPMPNMYRSEFTFLTSAYGSLQGLDGIYSFAVGSAGWDQQVSKFPVNTPATLGCFPAAALVYRLGYVREAPTVVMDHLSLDDLYALQGTSVYVAPAYDQFRAPSDASSAGGGESGRAIDPATFYVGRVARQFDGQTDKSYRQDLSRMIDHKQKLIRSVTGELALDYGRGLATMNAARAQGATGFLGRSGPVSLDNVTIHMQNDYGTVTIVALDDQPITASRKLLIQCMTVEQFYGFRSTEPKNLGGRIESIGTAPCGVEKYAVKVVLRLEGTPPESVVACDEHGYPRDVTVKCSGTSEGFTVELDPASPYHVVTR